MQAHTIRAAEQFPRFLFTCGSTSDRISDQQRVDLLAVVARRAEGLAWEFGLGDGDVVGLVAAVEEAGVCWDGGKVSWVGLGMRMG